MKIRRILPVALLPLATYAQSSASSATAAGTGSAAAISAVSISDAESNTLSTGSATGSNPLGDVAQTTNVTYISYTSTITRSGTAIVTTGASNATANGTITTSSTPSPTFLSGNASTATRPDAPLATNTQPCNGHIEFCQRSYSNITYIGAHNFPFIRQNNAARNQELGILDQLNDGIRMLQAQAHYVNDTFYMCHSDCDILNAGTLEDQLKLLVGWLDQNRYEVVTILLGNFFQGPPEQFLPAIQNSGLEPYLYIPPLIPMSRDDWPTMAEMILTNKRVVFFIDYAADQLKVPYILDEFSQMWETPFSPQDPAFPCTVDRPPELNANQTDARMYLVNHNLNVDLNAVGLGIDILVPNVAQINETNAAGTEFQMLGLNAQQCTENHGRRPNFLLVDFYNYGNYPGSVFEVAARMNNVTYERNCCGSDDSAASTVSARGVHLLLSIGVVFSFFLFM